MYFYKNKLYLSIVRRAWLDELANQGELN